MQNDNSHVSLQVIRIAVMSRRHRAGAEPAPPSSGIGATVEKLFGVGRRPPDLLGRRHELVQLGDLLGVELRGD